MKGYIPLAKVERQILRREKLGAQLACFRFTLFVFLAAAVLSILPGCATQGALRPVGVHPFTDNGVQCIQLKMSDGTAPIFCEGDPNVAPRTNYTEA